MQPQPGAETYIRLLLSTYIYADSILGGTGNCTLQDILHSDCLRQTLQLTSTVGSGRYAAFCAAVAIHIVKGRRLEGSGSKVLRSLAYCSQHDAAMRALHSLHIHKRPKQAPIEPAL